MIIVDLTVSGAVVLLDGCGSDGTNATAKEERVPPTANNSSSKDTASTTTCGGGGREETSRGCIILVVFPSTKQYPATLTFVDVGLDTVEYATALRQAR